MDIIKHKSASGMSHTRSLAFRKNSNLSTFNSHNSLSKLALAIGLTLSASSAWAATCGPVINQTTSQNCIATGTNEDAKITISGNNNINAAGTGIEGSGILADSKGTGQAQIISDGNLSIINSNGAHGMYAYGDATVGSAYINLSGTTNIELSGGTDTAVLATGGQGATIDISGIFNIVNHIVAAQERDGIEIASYVGGELNVNHTGEGTISVAGGNAIHLKAHGTSGNININLAGSGNGIKLIAEGDDHKGIFALSNASNTNSTIKINTNAHIETNGKNAYGIFANAINSTLATGALITGGLIEIVNSGPIYSNAVGDAGKLAHGIFALNKDHNTTISNSASIITNGDDASAIRAEHTVDSTSGNILIQTTGNSYLETNYKNADGIHAVIGSEQTGAATNNSGNITISAQGSIKTTGESSAEGIYAGNRHDTNTGNILINFNGNTIETTGTGANRGIYARQDGQGSVSVSHLGRLIKTAGDAAHALYVLTGTVNDAITSGDVLLQSAGAIETAGDGAHGIYADLRNSVGNVDITNMGNISTQGSNGQGILAYVRKDADKINIVNQGNITVTGEDSSAIKVSSLGSGDITVSHLAGKTITATTNTVNSTGRNDAIYVRKDAGSTGNITVLVEGDITTEGANRTGGVLVIQQGSGDVIVSGSGNITANASINNGVSEYSNGIAAGNQVDGVGNVTVDYYDGIIKTFGDKAYGIYASVVGLGGDAKIYNRNATIETQGNSAFGMYAQHTSAVKGTAEIYNVGGSVTTAGDSAYAIVARSNEGKITIGNQDSAVKTSGQQAHGIYATLNNPGVAADGIEITQIGGSFDSSGYNSHGILAVSNGQSGDIDINVTDTVMNLKGSNSDGINVQWNDTNASNVNINVTTNGGEINLVDPAFAATAQSNYGIVVLQRTGEASGDINITNNGTNITIGAAADGTATGGGAIHGAFQDNVNSSGNVNIFNSGELSTQGRGAAGIYGATVGTGNIDIINTNTIITNDAPGIYTSAEFGNTTVTAIGDITTGQATATTHNHGIRAVSKQGDTTVYYDNGTIKVVGNSLGGGNTIGIAAWDAASGHDGVNASINLGSGAIVDASEGVGALQIRANGSGIINIDNGAKVYGGHNASSADKGYAINIQATDATTAAQFEINNAGLIDALSDYLVTGSAAVDSTLIIKNAVTGVMTGYLALENIHSTVINEGVWNIRHFADTTGDGNRNMKAVSISDFGTGADVVINEATGVINLAAISSTTRAAVAHDTSNLGYQTAGALDISHDGIVQGHMVNVTGFENRGTIHLAENGLAGDVLAITGNAVVSNAAGDSIFTTNGGTLSLDTVLNEGGANSLSDILVVDHLEAGAEKTRLMINRVDGIGAVTEGDGVKVVEVLGNADAGSFELGHIVKAGLYEYTLHEGSQVTAGDNSLFLRTEQVQVNPDVGSYLINQAAATGLFMHTLHDRLGEPQYYENYYNEEKTIPALWIRAVSGHTKNEAAGGRLNQHSVDSLLHLGGEIANWTDNSGSRYHAGIMGAYGRSEGKTTSRATGSRVKSTVDGYGVGAYLTWYSEPAVVEGWYTDLWTMYNWFENETEGSEKYDSSSWTVSLEAGYATKLKTLDNYYWMLEPQGQIAHHHYNVDKIIDHNGLNVTNTDKNSITTRLGARTYLRPNEFHKNSAQPFLELNWWSATAKNSMTFNGEKVSNDTPRDRFEVKVGVQGEVTKNVQLYSHLAMQWGKDSYEHSEGQLGLRVRF